jgi:hypothetical protein
VIFNIGCEASGRKIRRLGEEQYRYPVLEVQKFDLIFQYFRLMNMTYTYDSTQNVRVTIMIIPRHLQPLMTTTDH